MSEKHPFFNKLSSQALEGNWKQQQPLRLAAREAFQELFSGQTNLLLANGILEEKEELFIPHFLPEKANIFVQPPFWQILQNQDLFPGDFYKTNQHKIETLSALLAKPGWNPLSKREQQFLLYIIRKEELMERSLFENSQSDTRPHNLSPVEYFYDQLTKALDSFGLEWQKYLKNKRYDTLGNLRIFPYSKPTPLTETVIAYTKQVKKLAEDSVLIGMEEIFPDNPDWPSQADFRKVTGLGKGETNTYYRIDKSGWRE